MVLRNLKKRRLIIWIVVFGLLLSIATLYLIGSELTKPVQGTVGEAPESPSYAAVSFSSESGSQLSGWFARRRDGAGGVVLLHGVRSDRRSMLGRARFLYKDGYLVLLFNLQAHGEFHG